MDEYQINLDEEFGFNIDETQDNKETNKKENVTKENITNSIFPQKNESSRKGSKKRKKKKKKKEKKEVFTIIQDGEDNSEHDFNFSDRYVSYFLFFLSRVLFLIF